jgi:alcohol dehydrogenase
VATTVSPEDFEYVKKLGADEVIDYKNQKFEDLLREYDAVHDTISGGEPEAKLS